MNCVTCLSITFPCQKVSPGLLTLPRPLGHEAAPPVLLQADFRFM